MKLPGFMDLALEEHIYIYMPSESGREVKVRTLKNKCKHAPLHAATATTTTTRVEKPLISTFLPKEVSPTSLEVEIFLHALVGFLPVILNLCFLNIPNHEKLLLKLLIFCHAGGGHRCDCQTWDRDGRSEKSLVGIGGSPVL